ncbi:MAG TPA: hypothetical protein VK489_00120 [Ferruginibacter sp.]|nr:hypothetical protein [Ferruginibacter sp.]
MKLYSILKHKLYVTFVYLTLLTLFISCSKTDTAEIVAPAGPATIANVAGPTGLTSGPKNTVITITGTNFVTNLAQIQVR